MARALAEPVTISSNGRDREVLGLGKLDNSDLEAIKASQPSEAFNHELEN
jgi:hypothetical protein